MIDDGFIKKCKDIFGPENVLTDKAELITYSYDATPGIPSEIPGVVVFLKIQNRFKNSYLLQGRQKHLYILEVQEPA